MTFVSIQQENLYTDITKTWIRYFMDTEDFSGVSFRTDTPDTDIDLKIPIVVLKRVSNDTWTIGRIGGYYGVHSSTSTEQGVLTGYTYSSLMQFDIMTTSFTECNRIQGLILKHLKPTINGGRTHIPLRTFAGTDAVGTPTDLNMKFYFHKDIDSAIIPTFDPNLHQHVVSVNLLIDHLTETIEPIVNSASYNYNI